MPEKRYAIAIDGPAGAGKTTLAKRLARWLGYLYVDTGAMYRTFALYMLRKEQMAWGQPVSISDALQDFSFSMEYGKDGIQHMFLNGEDVTSFIRSPEVTKKASTTSANPEVRARLLDCQRELAEKNNVIMEGRDIGTVILPNADVKFFLTADPLIRAYRRKKELEQGGKTVDPVELLANIIQRDTENATRELAPMKPAEGAIFVDCSEMSIDETEEKLLSYIGDAFLEQREQSQAQNS